MNTEHQRDFRHLSENHSAHWEVGGGGSFTFNVTGCSEPLRLAFDIEENGRKSSKRVMVSLTGDGARQFYEWLKPMFEPRG
jgi:hypothetical protein